MTYSLYAIYNKVEGSILEWQM